MRGKEIIDILVICFAFFQKNTLFQIVIDVYLVFQLCIDLSRSELLGDSYIKDNMRCPVSTCTYETSSDIGEDDVATVEHTNGVSVEEYLASGVGEWGHGE